VIFDCRNEKVLSNGLLPSGKTEQVARHSQGLENQAIFQGAAGAGYEFQNIPVAPPMSSHSNPRPSPKIGLFPLWFHAFRIATFGILW
jgi:hypothetical protein